MKPTFFRIRDLDPRIKVFLCLFYIILLLITDRVLLPLVTLALGLLFLYRIYQSPTRLLHRFEEPTIILAVLILLKSITGLGEAIFSLHLPLVGELSFYQKGLREGAFIALRVLASIGLVSILKELTPFHQLLSALAWYRVPREIVEILIFADRFMFHLLEEARVIYTAQKNRLGYVGIKKGLSSFSTLAGTLLLRVFDQSQRVALSMSLRGYEGVMPLSSLKGARPSEVIWGSMFAGILIGVSLL
ncbi:MAG: cobalt ECF transporter T component CbiQ [Desulfatiglandales bacterium]